MFSLRWLTDEDYPELVKWWEDWGWTAPTKGMLPNRGLGGVMVNKDGVNICAGFMYITNSDYALLEYIISNKEYRGKERKLALQELIDAISEVAKSQGFKHIFTSLKHPHLKRHFLSCGYIEGDTGTTELTINL